MADITYYYDTSFGGSAPWTDRANAFDGNLATFASTSGSGDYLRSGTTTCDGTDLGTITKVEVRVYGYGDGDDRIDVSFSALSPGTPEYQFTMPASEAWSAYADVTADANISGWTWAKVEDLSAGAGLDICAEKNNVGKGDTMYCSKVEIRVTYTPSNGGWSNIAKVSGVASAAMGKMNGMAVAAIAKVQGVASWARNLATR